jgi:TM2 domain-containing membrane protein YozV
MEDGGSRKRHLITSLQLGVAYNLCLHSIQTFPSAKLLESDPEKGTIHARVELTSEVYYSISRRTDGSSEILLEGAIVNEEKFWPDDPRRELLNRQLMNELDSLNGFLVSGISETYGVISSGFAGNVPAPSSRRKSVWISGLLSLLSPGMGQHYNGRFIRGIVILILTVFGLIIYLIPGILVWIFGIADAVRLAQKVNDGTYPYVSVPPTMLAAGIVATIPLLAFSLGAFILVAFGKTGVQMIGTFLGW